jgi:aminoglycoside phosphotransferase (APT) family kinase protein
VSAEATAPASAGWAIRYLLHIGVLTPAEVVGGAVEAVEVSVSHASFMVLLNGEARWVVKRADPARATGRGLGEEAAVYRMAGAQAQLARHLPAALHIAEDGQTLVLEAVAGEVGAIQPDALRASGAALAGVHSVLCPNFGSAPWLMTALQPRWGRYDWLPQPCATLLRQLRDIPSVRGAFDLARRQWRTGRLVHGDVRAANQLYVHTTRSVTLLDWELACSGDPAWDVGSMLADTLTITVANPPAGDPWPTVEQRWSEVLEGYCEVARLAPAAWEGMIERSIRLGGVRLGQSMLEHGYNGAPDLEAAAQLLWPWMMHLVDGASALGPRLAGRRAS